MGFPTPVIPALKDSLLWGSGFGLTSRPPFSHVSEQAEQAWLERAHDEGIVLCSRCELARATESNGLCECCNERLHDMRLDAERDVPVTRADFVDDGPVDEAF